MAEEYMTTEEVAALLKCTTVTVTRYVGRGHFPGTRKMDPTRKNSALRIPRQAVEIFVKSQVVSPDQSEQAEE